MGGVACWCSADLNRKLVVYRAVNLFLWVSILCVFQELLNRAVAKTEGAEVEPLEKLYALLAQCIYRHRNNYNKTELMKVRQPDKTHS